MGTGSTISSRSNPHLSSRPFRIACSHTLAICLQFNSRTLSEMDFDRENQLQVLKRE